jgi:hypothetical protein
MLDRLQELSAEALERAIERRVEREFEAARVRAGDCCDCAAPITGHPYNPQEDNAPHVKLAVQALLARRWWAEEAAPRWAQSVILPLTMDECVELINAGDARLAFVGGYGQHLRRMSWDLRRCLPFEAYCATAVPR